jgi:serine/threonine protein kinase
MCLTHQEMKHLSNRLKAGLNIASGLCWLASHGIVHRDLKLPNLLVFEDWTVKVGDFGLSLQIKEGQKVDRFGGNIKYSAPEILKIRYDTHADEIDFYPYSEKTDVYSFGLILWELVSLKTLFHRPKHYAGKKGLSLWVLEGNKPHIDQLWDNSLKTLLNNCFSPEPDVRPKFEEIVEMWPELTNNILCPDLVGRQILKALWGEKEDPVKLDEWKKSFGKYCFGDSHYLFRGKLAHTHAVKLLTCLVCNQDEDMVTKTRFANVVGWFGPIDRSMECEAFFRRIKDLVSKRYFHGYASESKVAAAIYRSYEAKREKFFAVRFSTTDVGAFIVSYMDDIGKVVHEKILNCNGELYIDSSNNITETFNSWKKIIFNWKLKEKRALPQPEHNQFLQLIKASESVW